MRRIKAWRSESSGNFRAWAYKLRLREQSQVKGATGRAVLTKFQRDAWRYALGADEQAVGADPSERAQAETQA